MSRSGARYPVKVGLACTAVAAGVSGRVNVLASTCACGTTAALAGCTAGLAGFTGLTGLAGLAGFAAGWAG